MTAKLFNAAETVTGRESVVEESKTVAVCRTSNVRDEV